MNDYRIMRKVKGSRVLFYPTVNGKRLTRINFARKWEARGLLQRVVEKYGENELHRLTAEATQ